MARRFSIGRLVFAGCLALALAGVAEAQDLTGTWNLTVEVPTICTWMGPATFLQTVGALAGSGNLALTAGTDPPCPPALLGTVAGTVTGTTVGFGLTTPLGPIDFTGTSDAAGSTMSGTWTFAVAGAAPLAGTWSATRAPVMPSLPEWGMLLMVSALLASGVYLLRRRPSFPL